MKLCKELAQTLAFQLQHGSVGGCAAAAPLELLLQLWDEAAVSEVRLFLYHSCGMLWCTLTVSRAACKAGQCISSCWCMSLLTHA